MSVVSSDHITWRADKGTPEKFAVTDYSEFVNFLSWADNRTVHAQAPYRDDIMQRAHIAYTALNEFVSVLPGRHALDEEPDEPARYIAIYAKSDYLPWRKRPVITRNSSLEWLYDNPDDFNQDPLLQRASYRPYLLPLRADSLIAQVSAGESKKDTRNLMGIILDTMGVESRATTSGYKLNRNSNSSLRFHQDAFQYVFEQIYDEVQKGEIPAEKYRFWGLTQQKQPSQLTKQNELF